MSKSDSQIPVWRKVYHMEEALERQAKQARIHAMLHRNDEGTTSPVISAVNHARDILLTAKKRDKVFGGDAELFRDPAWFILLDLLVRESSRQSTTVSSACIASGVAPTTALRSLSWLEQADLIGREADPFDKRRFYLFLTQRARKLLGQVLDRQGGTNA